jgi:hypothetical protein
VRARLKIRGSRHSCCLREFSEWRSEWNVFSDKGRTSLQWGGLVVVVALAWPPLIAHAQLIRSAVPVIGDSVDRQRLAQLDGGNTDGFMLRSLSSLTRDEAVSRGNGIRLFAPRVHVISNSNIPFSMNDGPMWAGRGVSSAAMLGLELRLSALRLVVLPEFIAEENRYWPIRDTVRFFPPDTPPERSGGGYVFPWYAGPYSVDLPLRFGNEGSTRLDPGQSSLTVGAGPVEVGMASENQWWGPGIRNALVLSNNAPGFPHLFIRSARPWESRLGAVELRWLVGGLRESEFFDTTSTNDLRSLSAFAVTFTPRRWSNLTVGMSRSMMGTASGWGDVWVRWFEAFHPTRGVWSNVPNDSTLASGGREQISTLFARWVAPSSGFEAYAEWGRTELPRGVRDFLEHPNHTQGYTLGLQWKRGSLSDGAFRLQSEITMIEQSATFRNRPIGSWYTSRRVIQGYTNKGQSLGAAIGPGASSQWIAGDYLKPGWSLGAYFGRIRWHEDVRSVYGWPAYLAYCNHDVTVLGGVRGGARGRWGSVYADATTSQRLNAFFQVQSGCPQPESRIDVRNGTLSVTFAPFGR